MLSEQRDDLGEDWFAHKLPFVVLRNNTGSDFKFLSHLRIENVKSSSLVITTALSQITPRALDPSIKVASLRFINVWTTCMYLKDTANVLDVRRVALFHTVLYISYILEMNGIVGSPPT